MAIWQPCPPFGQDQERDSPSKTHSASFIAFHVHYRLEVIINQILVTHFSNGKQMVKISERFTVLLDQKLYVKTVMIINISQGSMSLFQIITVCTFLPLPSVGAHWRVYPSYSSYTRTLVYPMLLSSSQSIRPPRFGWFNQWLRTRTGARRTALYASFSP